MKFHSDGPSIPDKLLESCDAGNVVFFCGAGVSINYGMPSFSKLTGQVIEKCDPPRDSEIRKAIRTSCGDDYKFKLPLDQIFELLHQEYGKEFVNERVDEILRKCRKCIRDDQKDSPEHDYIRRISSSRRGLPQIVTTNFDTLFETECQDNEIKIYDSPDLPDLDVGQTVEGVTYLHGWIEGTTNKCPCNDRYVLSSSDHGLVYLADGRVTNFIVNLFKKHTVVLVGYSAEDPLVKYLLLGLNKSGQLNNSNLFAFDRGANEEIEAKWSNLGVSALAYTEHCTLWSTMEAWAERADDHEKWKHGIISQCHKDPKRLAPHERGQVTHILKTSHGAQLFAEANLKPHPEWICVIDTSVRLSKGKSKSNDLKEFDYETYYGIDDDANRREGKDGKPTSGNILNWLEGDENPPDFHRLGELQAKGWEAIPDRLQYLINWIVNSIDSPVIAWWAIRKNGLHPRLIYQIQLELNHFDTCDNLAKHIWNLILECQRNGPRVDGNCEDLVDVLKRRIKSQDWTSNVMRDFQRVSAPKLSVNSFTANVDFNEPALSWDEFALVQYSLFEVQYPPKNLFDKKPLDLGVPDEKLPDVIKILEGNLNKASLLLQDIGMKIILISTFYTKREVDLGIIHNIESKYVETFIRLFDKLVEINPKLAQLAKAYALSWSENDKYFFRKIKLYVFNNAKLFDDANEVADLLLDFDDKSFWDICVARELLFLLVDRWAELSEEKRKLLFDRLLKGRESQQNPSSSDEELSDNYRFSAQYLTYLKLEGCELSSDQSERLSDLTSSIPSWDDSWARMVVKSSESKVGLGRKNESPGALINLPIKEVVAKAKELMKSEWGSLEDKYPFSGLVDQKPRKALLALMWEAKSGSYPKELWAELIDKFPKIGKDVEETKDPEGVNDRLKYKFLHQLKRLPKKTVAELGTNLGCWLEKNLNDALKIDNDLGWDVFDHIVDGIKFSYDNAMPTNGVVGSSRQTANRNISTVPRRFENYRFSPIGKCASALIDSIAQEEKDTQSMKFKQIKIRIDRLFAMKGEVSKQVVSITMSRLDCIYSVDPKWVKSRLLPMLKFEHPSSVPAWIGLLEPSEKRPQDSLLKLIEPKLIQIFPWVEGLSMYNEFAYVAAEWLGYMRRHQEKTFKFTECEMRDAIRKMSENTRCHFIDWLGECDPEIGGIESVLLLIKEDWPRELKIKTTATTLRWIQLLKDNRGNFSELYAVIKGHLSKIDSEKIDYEYSVEELLGFFTRQNINDQSIASCYPEEALDLMYRTIRHLIPANSNLLSMFLGQVAEFNPELIADCRYQELTYLSKPAKFGGEDESQEHQ